jgi:hypothetical protein
MVFFLLSLFRESIPSVSRNHSAFPPHNRHFLSSRTILPADDTREDPISPEGESCRSHVSQNPPAGLAWRQC